MPPDAGCQNVGDPKRSAHGGVQRSGHALSSRKSGTATVKMADHMITVYREKAETWIQQVREVCLRIFHQRIDIEHTGTRAQRVLSRRRHTDRMYGIKTMIMRASSGVSTLCIDALGF